MFHSPHNEHRSSGPRPVIFIRTSKLFSFYLELYKNKFSNLIRSSKFNFKFSFRGLVYILENWIMWHRLVLYRFERSLFCDLIWIDVPSYGWLKMGNLEQWWWSILTFVMIKKTKLFSVSFDVSSKSLKCNIIGEDVMIVIGMSHLK
jgi:hypothetical protein